MLHPFFANKQILVIDRSPKNKNDHTWCYWETKAGIFEPVVHHQWKQIDFYSTDFSARFDIEPYTYKMIRSIDLYNYVYEESAKYSNIHFQYGNVESLKNENDKAVVTVDGKKFYASYVFNSIIFNHGNSITGEFIQQKAGSNFLLQHFKGWVIEVTENIFDERISTFMDFRVEQTNGTTFVYALPVSKNKMLVEYTLFSGKILPQNEYDDALKKYISEYLKIELYKITEEEFGMIPMTDHKFPPGNRCIINMGTAGGQTKASSGFTFQFIQKHATAIVEGLVTEKSPHTVNSFVKKRFSVYDSTLLQILINKKMDGDKIFAQLFKENPPQRVLKFLDNETNLSEELKIMQSVPSKVFLPAAIKSIFKAAR